MQAHSLKMIQNLPAPLSTVWELFSNPNNLLKLTPGSLGLKILSTSQRQSIFTGQLIEYKVRPLLGIPLYWMTEITSVDPLRSFIDEQRKGPYRLWKHEHGFREIEGGVEMTDHVQYKNPLGPIGRLANTLLVKKKLETIFEYRFQAAEKLLGKWEGQCFEIQFS